MNRASRRVERGLTLIELLVVVVILATIAQTALVTADRLVDEERFTRTTAALESAEVAIFGRRNALDPSGRLWAEGFVADVGRLPIVRELVEGTPLSELWLRTSTTWSPEFEIHPFGLQIASGDPQVRLPCGWRGPYLQLGIGKSAWFDGWGAAPLALDESGEFAQIGETVTRISSLGADGEDGGEGYDEDLALELGSVGISRHLGAIPVRVVPDPNVGGQIVVRVFGPQNGKLVTLQQQVAATAGGADAQFVFADIPIGPRVVRAYQITLPPTAKDLPLQFAIASEIRAVVVVHGGIPEVEFDLGEP